jgi:hypothetical protein
MRIHQRKGDTLAGEALASRLILLQFILLIFITSWSLVEISESKAIINNPAPSSTQPIRIESNSDLFNHEEVDSGTGSVTDPFVISDLTIDCRTSGKSGLYIRNTTYHVVFMNITIHASSQSPAIYLRSYYSGGYHSMNLDLINVTVIGGGQHLYMYVPIRVYISGCNFSNPVGNGDLVYSYYGYYVDMHNNSFNSPGMDIDFERTYYIDFTKNHGSIRYYQQDRFQYSEISNNTFSIRSCYLYSGYFSNFQGNHLTGSSSSYDLLWLSDCNRIKIANNTFMGGKDAIGVQHPNTYDPVRTSYESWSSLIIEYNLFNGTGNRGLYFYWASGHPIIAYMDIHHNEFMGCGGYAIELNLGGSGTSLVYRNVFMYNHGSSTEHSSLTSQARDDWSQFRWRKNGVGNYWLDWDNTDENSDGFSDLGDYSISSNNGQSDPFPISNRYFDFGPPHLELFSPVTRFLDTKYVNLTWSAYDNETGISMIRIRKNMGKWTNVTGREHHGLYLSNGQHNIDVRAIDLGGLRRDISINLIIENGKEPVSIVKPSQWSYHGTSSIDVSWEFMEIFVAKSLSCRIEGSEWKEKDPFESHMLELPDGVYNYEMRFSDHYGNSISKTIGFTVDTQAPELEILDPPDLSVISNSLVNLNWRMNDLTGIKKTKLVVDGEVLTNVQGTSYSIFLEKGTHIVSVEVMDMAGNVANESREFRIGENTSLHITSPRIEHPSRDNSFTVKWEYLTSLKLDRIQIFLDDLDPLDLSVNTTSYRVTFTEDGIHTIKVEASDPAGNIFSDSITVVVDRIPPTVGFLNLENGQILNSSRIVARWGSGQGSEIAGYDILVDDQKVASNTLETEKTIEFDYEGTHTLVIKAYDKAGNMGLREIFVVVDTTPPDLELLRPLNATVIEQYVTFEWSANDLNGLDHYSYMMDGEGPLKLGLGDSLDLRLSEGDHIFILTCVDKAGNSMSVRKNFKVDLNPPVVEIINLQDGYRNYWMDRVEWSIFESMGVENLLLKVDDLEMPLSNTTRYQMIDLVDGFHTIEIFVDDIGGQRGYDSVQFTLDRIDPLISNGKIELDENLVRISWSCEEDISQLEIVSIMDGIEIVAEHDLENGFTIFREVPEGIHTLNLTFKDRAGNEKDLGFDFEIENRGMDKKSEGEGSILIPVVIILIVIALIGATAFILIRKKGNDDEISKQPKTPIKPDKISIGPIPAVKGVDTVIPGKAPPIGNTRKTASMDTGDSYIRPEKAKQSSISKDRPNRIQRRYEQGVKSDIGRSPMETTETIEDWTDMEDIEELEELEEF